MTKKELRKQMQEQLAALGREERLTKSDNIFANILELPEVHNANRFFVYVSVGNEVHTYDLIQTLIDDGKVVTVPKIVGKGTMEAHRIYTLDELTPGAYSIPEPETNPYFGMLDVCIVPGIAFSEEGARLGRGAGFYDRFLEGYQTFAIGLAYDRQILPELPEEEHDILMDLIVTEGRIIRR